jgi:hypothetical protein
MASKRCQIRCTKWPQWPLWPQRLQVLENSAEMGQLKPVDLTYWSISVKVRVKFKSGTPSRSTWCGPEWPLKGVKQVCNNLGAWAQTWASSLGLNEIGKREWPRRDSAGAPYPLAGLGPELGPGLQAVVVIPLVNEILDQSTSAPSNHPKQTPNKSHINQGTQMISGPGWADVNVGEAAEEAAEEAAGGVLGAVGVLLEVQGWPGVGQAAAGETFPLDKRGPKASQMSSKGNRLEQ